MKKRVAILLLLFLLPALTIGGSANQVLAWGDFLGGGIGSNKYNEQQDKKKREYEERQEVQKQVPQKCIDDPGEYGNCPTDYYKLVYIPKEVEGPDILSPIESTEEGIRLVGAMVLNFGVVLYVHGWVLALEIMGWAIDTPFLKLLMGPLENTIDVMVKWIWVPLWALVVLLAMGNMLYHIYQKRYYVVYTHMASIVIISALSISMFINLPQNALTVHNTMNEIGKYTIAGMLKYAPTEEEIEQEKEEEERMQNQPSRVVAQKVEEEQEEKENVTEEEAKSSQDDAIQQVQTQIFRTVVYEPLMVMAFGSVENGEKYFPKMIEYAGDRDDLREEWVTGQQVADSAGNTKGTQYVDPDTGQANPKYADAFEQMTAAGLMDLAIKFFGTVPSGSMMLLLVIGLSIWAIWTVCKVIAKLFWGLIRCLAAIHPEKGWGELLEWVMQVVTTASMKFFILILLGAVLVLWSGVSQIDTSEIADNWVLAFIGKSFIQILLTVALYVEFRVAMKTRIPLPGGGSISLMDETDQTMLGMMKRGLGTVRNVGIGGVIGGIKGMKQTAKTGTKALGKTAAAYLGYANAFKPGFMKEVAKHQQAKRNVQKARGTMERMGYSPDSVESRQAFIKNMTNQGQKDFALETVSKLKPITQTKTPSELKSRLSPAARNLYIEMKEAGQDPLNAKDRAAWLQSRPHEGWVMEELNQYATMPHWKRMASAPPTDWTAVPPERPQFNTPEWDLWQDQGYQFLSRQFEKTMDEMESERIRQYQQEVRQYREISPLKRWFTPEPKAPKPPTDKEVLTKLRKQAEEAKRMKEDIKSG